MRFPKPLEFLQGRQTTAGALSIQTQRASGYHFNTPLILSAPQRQPTPQLARQEVPSTTSVSAPAGGIPSTPGVPMGPVTVSTGGQPKEVDVDNLTEQVIRRLMRRLAVERERRGIGRWN
jgi:hypothetical protein